MWSGVVMEKGWALSVDQCWLQLMQVAVKLTEVLSILLRCNGFTGIQKVVVDQTSSRLPVTMTTFWWNLPLESALELLFSPTTEPVVTGCHVKSTFLCTSQSKRDGSLLCRVRDDDTSKRQFCWFSVNPWGTYFSDFFTFPICFKCHVIVDWTTISFSIKI